MKSVGIHPRICSWISNFLENRYFQVRLGKTLSGLKPVKSGVPQGGVLSPLLFLIYTYDLPKKLSEIGVTCKMYADDLKIYRIVENDSDCDVIQKAVSYVECWASHWNLPLNAEKTTVLTLG